MTHLTSRVTLAVLVIHAIVSAHVITNHTDKLSELTNIVVHGDTCWCATRGGIIAIDAGAKLQGSFGTPEGLPATAFYSAAVDTGGVVWFGYRGNLVSFSHSTWHTVELDHDYRQSFIDDLAISPNNELWMSISHHGIARYDGDSLVHITADDGLLNNMVYDIALGSAGAIWIATRKGIAVLKESMWDTITTEDGLPENFVFTIAIDNNNSVWCGTPNNGVCIYDGSEWTYVNSDNGLPGGMVTSIAFDSSNAAWIGTMNGCCRYDGETCRNYTVENGLLSNDVWDVSVDIKGRVWIAAGMGMTIIDGETVRQWKDNGIALNSINDLCIHQGVLWCAGKGLSMFKDDAWSYFDTSNGLIDLGVNSLFSVGDDSLWIGTNNGVSIHYQTEFVNIPLPDELPSGKVEAINRDQNGTVWAGTYKGLCLYSGGVFALFKDTASIYRSSVKDIEIDRHGNVWCCIGYRAMAIDPNTHQPVSWRSQSSVSVDDNSLYRVWDIAIDSLDGVWFAAEENLIHYPGSLPLDTITAADGPTGNWYTVVAVDPDGYVWSGGQNGLDINNGESWTHICMEHGLVDNWVTGIVFDSIGNTWVGTQNGLSMIMRDSPVVSRKNNPKHTGRIDIERLVVGFTRSRIGITFPSILRQNVSVRLYMANGRCVFRKEISDNETAGSHLYIDCDSHINGMGYLDIRTGNKHYHATVPLM